MGVKRLALALAGALGALGGVYFLLREGPEEGGVHAEGVTPEVARSDPEEGPQAEVAAAAPGATPAEPPSEEASDERQVVGQEPAEAEPAAELEVPVDGLLVKVVDERGQPRAGVPVGILIDAPSTPRLVHRRDTTRAPRGATTFRLPPVPPHEVKGAYRYLACINLPLDPPVEVDVGPSLHGQSIELVLPDAAHELLEPIRLRVVDGRGSGVADWPLELRWSSRGHTVDHELSSHAEGWVEVDRGLWAEKLARACIFGDAGTAEARLLGPILETPSVALPEDGVWSTPPQLTLPPTGSVVVRLLESAERPFDGPAEVTLRWRRADDVGGYSTRDPWIRHPVESGAGGVLRFGHVGLGLSLELMAAPSDRSRITSTEGVTGPTVAGQEVEVPLVLGVRRPFLRLRVVDAEGRPLVERSLGLREFLGTTVSPSSSRRGHSTYVTTDAAGRLRRPVSPSLLEAGVCTLEIVENAIRREGSGWVPRYARKQLPEGLAELMDAEGNVELGDVVLQPQRELVAGWVEDPRGRWLKGAQVWVQYEAGRKGKWQSLHGGRIYSATDGSFVAYGLPDYERLRARAQWSEDGRRAWSPWVEVDAYTLDVKLVVPDVQAPPQEDPTGTVVGELLLDPEISRGDIRLEVSGVGNSQYLFRPLFMIPKVPVGEVALEVLAHHNGLVLERVEGVQVAEGLETEDDRLWPIDLRARLVYADLRFVRPDGTPLEKERFQFFRGSGTHGNQVSGKTDKEGRARVLVRKQDRRLSVRIDGQVFEVAEVGAPTTLVVP